MQEARWGKVASASKNYHVSRLPHATFTLDMGADANPLREWLVSSLFTKG